MLATASTIAVVANALKRYNHPFSVVDPVRHSTLAGTNTELTLLW